MGEEQASLLKQLLLSPTTRVPILLLQRMEEKIPAVRERLNCMDIPKNEPGPCTGTCQISSDDGNEVVGKRGEDVFDIEEEEDPAPATSTGIKTEPGIIMGDKQASCLGGLLQSSTARVPIVLLQRVEEVIPAMRENLNCMDILKSEPGPCTGTCQMSSDNESEVVGNEDEEVTDVKEEEDPGPATGIKTEPAVVTGDEQATLLEMLLLSSTTRVPIDLLQSVEEVIPAVRESLNCVDILKSEPGPCSGTCQISSDDGNEVVGKIIEEVTDVKVEEDPAPAASTGIKTEPANCVDVLRDEHESCTETCSASSGDGKQFVFVNVDDDDCVMKWQEDPEPTTSTTIKNDPVRTVNGQLCTCSRNCATSCDACNKAFGERTFSCDVCNKTFSCQDYLITHQQIHSGEWPLSSHVCNIIFVQKPHLIQHLQMHIEDRPFSCDVCHKAFVCQSSLVVHKRVHSGERPYSCDICNKAFIQKGHLMTHKLIHSGLRPFTCEVCHKAFVRQDGLRKHKQVHSGERPYSCDICNKAFIQKDHLMTHKLSHIGVRPFPCEVCHKAFLRNGDLMKHKQVHSGERPFVCDVCSKAFVWKHSLVQHTQKHSAEETSLMTHSWSFVACAFGIGLGT